MIVRSRTEYAEVLEKALKEPYLAIDIEGEEFTKEKDHAFELALYGIGIYGKDVQAYIPKKFLDQSFQEVLNATTSIFHNAKFDMTMIEKEGYDVSNIKFHDTMILAYLLDENRMSFGLKQLTADVLKVKTKIVKFKDLAKRPVESDFGLFPNQYQPALERWEDEMGTYCIADCEHTYKLFEIFWPKIEEDEKLKNAYLNIEVPMITVLRKMENRGIAIDTEYLKKMGEQMFMELARIKGEIWKEAGKEFDINSPKQLSEILFTEKKYELPEEYQTKKGSQSTNVKALEYLQEKQGSNLAKLILDYREVFKLYSTYVEGLLERQKNGIIYGSFKQTGTKTGRLSSSNPNLQQIPRRDDQFNIRNAFVARPGYTFVISDLSQIELRLLAFYSKDPTLMKAYQEGKDIHQQTADLIGCPRVVAKTVNFGIAYGRRAQGLAMGLNMPLEQAQKFIDDYFRKFKNIAKFIQNAENTVERRYKVQTLLGRYRRFPEFPAAVRKRDRGLMNRIKRQGVNAIIQGSAADIMKVMMRNISRKVEPMGCHLLVQIHDEVLIETPVDIADEVAQIVKYEMENAVKLPGVPIVTEPGISPRWKK